MPKTLLLAVHRVEKKTILGNSAVSVNADGRKTVCNMVGWLLRERAACKGCKVLKITCKTAQRISNSPLLHTVGVLKFLLLYSPPHAWAHQAGYTYLQPIPPLRWEAHPQKSPLFFALAQKTQIFSHFSPFLFADQE